jgi:hypothetical protein
MSVYTSVYALDSKIKAPEIGDSGCIGFPPVSTDGEQHEFLRIYKGLGRVGLTTRELDCFNAFIETYKGEQIPVFGQEGDENTSRQNTKYPAAQMNMSPDTPTIF